ncbi:MAG: caspase family protein [Bacteroidota bacterium]
MHLLLMKDQMKTFIFFFLLLFPYLLMGQQKGVAPVGGGSATAGAARALVIGVSKYQDSAIPSLRFAHRDAEEFVAYLKSRSGGSLQAEQIELITNEQATAANIYSKLDWLLEVTTEGEQVIIYFSGHGDVETATSRNRGFLLAHDTPPTNYRIGALRVNDLNDVLADLVEINKARVLLIADACRSGKLAGGADGATSTASALSQEFKNQVKILSCKPDEFSLEGEQWGGGRGVFSYHLIDGLMGMANLDSNEGEIFLFELEDYLKNKIQQETDYSQSPVLVGSSKSPLSQVNREELEALTKRRNNEVPTVAFVRSKGMETELLAKADTTVQKLYEEFLAALDDQYFLPEDFNENRKAGKSASELYDVLLKENALQPLHSSMKRNFAVALQDESQKSINAYLKADPEELNERWKNFGRKYKSNPAYLNKAASLLGESHYLFDQLMAKMYYYEGLILRLEGEKSQSDSLFNKGIEKIEKALEYDNESAFLHNEIGLLNKRLYEMKNGNNVDTAAAKSLYDRQIGSFNKAIEASPKWIMPYINLANLYLLNSEWDKSKQVCLLAMSIDSTQLGLNFTLGQAYAFTNEYKKAAIYLKKTIEIAPDFSALFYANLGDVYINTEQYELAEDILLKGIKLDSTFTLNYNNLGFVYYTLGEYEKSMKINLKWIEVSPQDSMPYFNMACLSSLKGQGMEAVAYLKKAVENGFDKYDWIENDEDLKNARAAEPYEMFKLKYLSDN